VCVIGRCWIRYTPGAASVRVTEVEGEELYHVRRHVTVIPQDCVMTRSVSSLNAGVTVEIKVEVYWVSYLPVDHCARRNVTGPVRVTLFSAVKPGVVTLLCVNVRYLRLVIWL